MTFTRVIPLFILLLQKIMANRQFSAQTCAKWCEMQTKDECGGALWNKYTLKCKAASHYSGKTNENNEEIWIPRNDTYLKVIVNLHFIGAKCGRNWTIAIVQIIDSIRLENEFPLKVKLKKYFKTNGRIETYMKFSKSVREGQKIAFLDKDGTEIKLPNPTECELLVTNALNENDIKNRYVVGCSFETGSCSLQLQMMDSMEELLVGFLIKPQCSFLRIHFEFQTGVGEIYNGYWKKNGVTSTSMRTLIKCKATDNAGKLSVTNSSQENCIRLAFIENINKANLKIYSFNKNQNLVQETSNYYDYVQCCSAVDVNLEMGDGNHDLSNNYVNHFQIWTHSGLVCELVIPTQTTRLNKNEIHFSNLCDGICLDKETINEIYIEKIEGDVAIIASIKVSYKEELKFKGSKVVRLNTRSYLSSYAFVSNNLLRSD